MSWYKMHHGAAQDSKLAVIARRAGCRRGEALALWVTLLNRASHGAPRGSVRDVDPEELSVSLEFDTAVVDAALKAFRDKGVIAEDGMLADWERSQKLSTRRTRAHRARLEKDKEETDDARRQRLQKETLARHRKRGRIIAK